MPNLPERFSEYISSDCNRCSFITSYLAAHGVDSAVLPVEGKNHVYVKFPSLQYNPQFRIKTVIAHYDRAPGSPGANDNSAADFCLMDWAVRLRHRPDFHNVRMLFTDGEELGANGISEQGAFSLAAVFRRLGIVNDDVYVFDCTGRGTVPVLAKNAVQVSMPYSFRRNLADLEERAENLLRTSGAGRWLTLPLPYSDNAGFIACGIPAVVITMLPEMDADRYLASLMRCKQLEDFVTNHELPGKNKAEAAANLVKYQSLMPDTWKLFHTPDDSEQNLTPESFGVTAEILDVLADMKTLV